MSEILFEGSEDMEAVEALGQRLAPFSGDLISSVTYNAVRGETIKIIVTKEGDAIAIEIELAPFHPKPVVYVVGEDAQIEVTIPSSDTPTVKVGQVNLKKKKPNKVA